MSDSTFKDNLVKYLSERLDTNDQEHIEIINHLADGIVHEAMNYFVPLTAQAVYNVLEVLSQNKGVRDETIIAKPIEDLPEFSDWHSRHGSGQ